MASDLDALRSKVDSVLKVNIDIAWSTREFDVSFREAEQYIYEIHYPRNYFVLEARINELCVKLQSVIMDLAEINQHPPEEIQALKLTEEQTHDLKNMKSRLEYIIKEMKRRYNSLYQIYPGVRQQ